jgi:hypothetical protein
MSEHEEHPVHPVAAGVVILLVALLFAWIFSLMGGGWGIAVAITGVSLAAWGFVTVLALDKTD